MGGKTSNRKPSALHSHNGGREEGYRHVTRGPTRIGGQSTYTSGGKTTKLTVETSASELRKTNRRSDSGIRSRNGGIIKDKHSAIGKVFIGGEIN